MGKVNPDKDAAVLKLIAAGRLVCRRDGTITKDGRKVGYAHNSGYLAVDIQEPKRYVVLAHRIVWMFFKGPIPEGFMPNHIDTVKTNNAIGNLELLTNKENVDHAIASGANNIGARMRGVGNHQSKLSEEQVNSIRRVYGKRSAKTKKKFTARYLAKVFKVSHPTILSVVKGESYSSA